MCWISTSLKTTTIWALYMLAMFLDFIFVVTLINQWYFDYVIEILDAFKPII